MLGHTYDSEVCSAARALEIVGERWTLLIIRNALFAGSTRFRDFTQKLGLATNVLSSRLDGLVEAGLMRQSDDQYLLTEAGHGLVPVILALTEWGDRYRSSDGRPIIYRHADCGGEVHLTMNCSECLVLNDQADVRATPGPGMPAGRAPALLPF